MFCPFDLIEIALVLVVACAYPFLCDKHKEKVKQVLRYARRRATVFGNRITKSLRR